MLQLLNDTDFGLISGSSSRGGGSGGGTTPPTITNSGEFNVPVGSIQTGGIHF
jgi:hypothetical protein